MISGTLSLEVYYAEFPDSSKIPRMSLIGSAGLNLAATS